MLMIKKLEKLLADKEEKMVRYLKEELIRARPVLRRRKNPV